MYAVTTGNIQRFIMGFDRQFCRYIFVGKHVIIIRMNGALVHPGHQFGKAVQIRTVGFQVYQTTGRQYLLIEA